jgi:hypothetical protein
MIPLDLLFEIFEYEVTPKLKYICWDFYKYYKNVYLMNIDEDNPKILNKYLISSWSPGVRNDTYFLNVTINNIKWNCKFFEMGTLNKLIIEMKSYEYDRLQTHFEFSINHIDGRIGKIYVTKIKHNKHDEIYCSLNNIFIILWKLLQDSDESNIVRNAYKLIFKNANYKKILNTSVFTNDVR